MLLWHSITFVEPKINIFHQVVLLSTQFNYVFSIHPILLCVKRFL